MAGDGIGQVTQRARDCLRLVARGQSSKEIGLELGISHHTVDLHLKRAMKALGAPTRRNAARLLFAHEQDNSESRSNQLLATQPQDIATGADLSPLLSHRGKLESQPGIPFLRRGKRGNELSGRQRLLWAAVLALAFMFVIANFLNGLGVLFNITG